MLLRRIILSIIAITMIFFACSSKHPSMSIKPEKWEMTDIMAGSTTKQVFWVKNSGAAPLLPNFRANCDCIEIIAEPDTVFPGDSSRLIAEYIAPDDSMDSKKILFDTNDPEHKVGKIPVTASIVPFVVTNEDKNFTVIPFSVQIDNTEKYDSQILKALAIRGAKAIDLKFEDFKPLLEKVMQDPQYGKEEVTSIVRKWAGSMGIRYTILGEMKMQGGKPVLLLIVQDAMFQYPITRAIQNPDLENVDQAVVDEVDDIFANISSERRNALINNMQTKWMEARKELVGKPAPPLKLSNVLTGGTYKIHKMQGNIVFMHFLSIDCEHCETEIEWVSELSKKMPDVKFFGISVDVGEKDSVIAFVKEKDIDYPILLPNEEQSHQLEQYYGGATPQTVLIDKKGNVREIMMGFNRKITNQFSHLLNTMQNEK
ncbi:MAG: redoxin domain-containing protein [Candidatus Zixiibacteriota bacterium]